MPDEHLDEITLLSAALDEIFRLRRALAYEACVTRVHLGYATFPKSRRPFAEEQVERMSEAARGHAERAYAGCHWTSLRHALLDVGAKATFTRYDFEQEVTR